MTRREEFATTAKGKPAPDKRIPLNLLFGLPDDNKASIAAIDNGKRLDISLPGTVGIAPILPQERFALTSLYMDPSAASSIEIGPGALLNLVADPDRCSKSLVQISEVVAKVPRPCFNHPDAIARTSRDQVSRALAGIEGLDVPKAIRTAALAPESLARAIAEAGLSFPVLVRVTGSHGGIDMVRVAGPDSCGEIRKLPPEADSYYVTEFRDFVSPDGHYRKARIMVVGDEIFMRHHVVANSWNVHVSSRTKEGLEEEKISLPEFQTGLAYRLRPLFLEIGRRLDLDYFGVDCNLGENGRITLFEANAAMFVLKNTEPSPNIWDKPITRIKAALLALLTSPKRWRDYEPSLARAKALGQ